MRTLPPFKEPWGTFFSLFDSELTFPDLSAPAVPCFLNEQFDPSFMTNAFEYQTERVGMTAQGRAIHVFAQTDALPTLKAKMPVRLNGVDYQLIPGWHPIDDGKLMQLSLAQSYV